MKSTDDALLEGWNETLRQAANLPAIFDTSHSAVRSFGQIEESSRSIAASLIAGLEPGSVLAIQIGSHVDWPALLLACLRQKVVVLPLERTMAPAERDAALATCRAVAIIEADGASISGPISRRALSGQSAKWDGNPPVLLKLTSGTTAAPRAIRFRSSQLRADADQICDTMAITAADLNFAGIPLTHSYGFSNLVLPLLSRAVPMVLSRDRMPRAVLNDLARTGATVFPGMPVFFQAFCEMEDVPALPALRLCISAGAPLPLKIARKFRGRFGHAIHSFYGSSECGGICYDREGELLEEGFVGPPMLGVRLEFLEPEASSSRVRVFSAAAGDDYFPHADREKFNGVRFLPDDLISPTQKGMKVVGRVSDVINVAGKKVHPAEVEAALLGFPGVSEAVAFGCVSALRNEEVVACIVASGEVNERELLHAVRARLSGWQVPKRILFLDQIPVNDRGKISRRALAQLFAESNGQRPNETRTSPAGSE